MEDETLKLGQFYPNSKTTASAVGVEKLISLPEPNHNGEVLGLFVKGAEKIECWLNGERLYHSILCNYAGNEKYEGSTFCNCGLTDIICALQQYRKTEPK